MSHAPAIRIRSIQTFVQVSHPRPEVPQEPALTKVAAVAIMNNPFAGRYVADLSPLVAESYRLGQPIVAAAHVAMGGVPVESYGKAALFGVNGDQEHAVAMITTPYGDLMREAIGGGKSWIPSISKRCMPGTSVDIPLAHKDALYVRSHYDGMTITLHDGPLADEMAVVCCFASGGRQNARLGGLHKKDIKGKDGLV